MKTKGKVIAFPERKPETLAQLLAREDLDSNKKLWPAIADAMWARISGARFGYFGGDLKQPALELSGSQHVRFAWNYQSIDAREYIDRTYAFDCALHPKLWRYLVERLPVLAKLSTEAP